MTLKDKVRKKQLTIGSWLTIPYPMVVEIMATAGFDWLVIDLEHSVITIREVAEMIRIIDLYKVTPLVRISSAYEPVQIKRVLDAGAQGIIIPSALEATVNAVIGNCYYPPKGDRSIALVRANAYGEKFSEYLDKEFVIIAQIENVQAVNTFDEIISAGIDGYMVGPYDLSGSLNILGEFKHPTIRGMESRFIKIANNLSVAGGCHITWPDVKQLQERIDQGYKFIAYGVDFIFLADSCRRDVREVKKTL